MFDKYNRMFFSDYQSLASLIRSLPSSSVAVVKEVIRGHAILGSKSEVNTLWYSVSSVPFVNQICQLFLPFSTKKND